MTRHRECLVCAWPGLTPLLTIRRVELVQCTRCTFVFSPRVPTASELVAHYDGYSRSTSWESPISVRRREQWLDEFERYRRLDSILDVGCGTGALLNQAKLRGWRTYGTEFTTSAIDICTFNGHCMTRGALTVADYAAESFDVIVYSEVIEHINNHREEFELVSTLLRPGGLLFVTTPNFGSISRKVLGDRWNVIQFPEHLAYFTPATLTRLMKEVGLSQAWIRTTGISLSRCHASVRAQQGPRSAPKQLGSQSADEKLRQMFETHLGRAVKHVLNFALDLAHSGDSINAGFVKPAAGDDLSTAYDSIERTG